MSTILNLTQHPASADQTAQGVTEPTNKEEVKTLLNFVGMPEWSDVLARAEALAEVASAAGVEAAMIGGAPYLMGPLHAALEARGIRPLYAFSERRSVEETLPDGSVKKTAVFVHLGFVG